MIIIYSWHSRKRMRQRGITELEVEYILKYPSLIRNAEDNKKIAISEIRNKAIKVVFIQKESYIKIVTIRY